MLNRKMGLKLGILFILFLFFIRLSISQSSDPWVRFYDAEKRLSGFKDLSGNIIIPPRFGFFTQVDTFYNIMAIDEKGIDKSRLCYLLKDLRRIACDSVYVFDFAVDCEKEEKIIFKDYQKDKVGFLDKNGRVIIPAMYQYVTPFRNGLSLAYRNAQRVCMDDSGDTTNCEHWGLQGGETILINEKNEIVAENVDVSELYTINWYSKLENVASLDTNLYVSIQGVNNTTYSFVDYKKEFKIWVDQTFLPAINLDTSQLRNFLFEEITHWAHQLGWIHQAKQTFFKQYATAFYPERFKPGELKRQFVRADDFNPYIYDQEIFNRYKDGCGYNDKKFPIFELIFQYYKKRKIPNPNMSTEFKREYEDDYQERFTFIRTEAGYKLFEISIRE